MDLFIGACISPPELQQLRAGHRGRQGPSAFSHEPLVLIYKAEQSSKALASVTEVFALDSYQTALGSSKCHLGQCWGPWFRLYVSHIPGGQLWDSTDDRLKCVASWGRSPGGLSNLPRPAEPRLPPLPTCLLTQSPGLGQMAGAPPGFGVQEASAQGCTGALHAEPGGTSAFSVD